jgi:hypothetical protein
MRQLKIIKQVINREDSFLDKYMDEIARIKLITTEEEVSLALRIHKGDMDARDCLINANLRFVISVSKQYQNQSLNLIIMDSFFQNYNFSEMKIVIVWADKEYLNMTKFGLSKSYMHVVR